MIYLDHNATTPIHPQVKKAMLPFLYKNYGNPSSIHSCGQKVKNAIEQARIKLARYFNAESPECIVFTSSATEANNLAIKGTAFYQYHKNNKKHLVTSKIEHHSVLNAFKYLEEKFGFEVTYLDVNEFGEINLKQLENSLTPNTALVSIMYANNEIGTIQPINEIEKICKKNKVIFHTDAVQAFGKINLSPLPPADLVSISAHKINGPKGIGALYIKKDLQLEPLLHGGPHELNRRAGTENTAGIIGLVKAVEIIFKNLSQQTKKILKLRNYLEKKLLEIKGVTLNGPPLGVVRQRGILNSLRAQSRTSSAIQWGCRTASLNRLPNTTNISIEGVDGEALVIAMDSYGICISTGSACATGEAEPSHVLLACGKTPQEVKSSIRISLGYGNTIKQIDYMIKILKKNIIKLRKITIR